MTESTRKPWRAAVIAAIVTFSVIAGTVGSWAYWSATGSATLGVGAATLSSTATGWATTTLGNENVSATSSKTLTATGSITLTNTTSTTSTSSQTLNATFSRASGSTVLAAATTLTVWSVASTAACTTSAVPTSPTSGLWSDGVTVSTTLAPGASVVYCLRNTIADRQNADDPSGTLTFTPQVAAVLRAGTNFTNTTTASSTISTQFIYPLPTVATAYWYYIVRAGTTWCWDVSGSGTADGSLLISYACKNNADTNQDFRFMDADGDGYGDFQPGHTSALRIEAAASTTSGSAVDMATAATTTAVQQWQPQLVASGTYQFVNKYSGLCLSAPAASTGVMTQVTCNGGADQKFTFTQRSVVQMPISCTPTGNGGTTRSASYTWTPDYAAGPYTVKAVSPGNATTQLVASQAGTSYAIPGPIGSPFTTATGAWSIEIYNAAGALISTDTFNVARSGIFSGNYWYGTC